MRRIDSHAADWIDFAGILDVCVLVVLLHDDFRSFAVQQQEVAAGEQQEAVSVVEQQDALSPIMTVVAAYCAGAASNFVSQPREQK
jgi:hypothetical protein